MKRVLRYLFCLLAGAALIHVVPHVLNGLTPRNLLGIAVSLLVGGALLWAGRFRWRDPAAVAMVLLGMALVMLYGHLRSGARTGVVLAEERMHRLLG